MLQERQTYSWEEFLEGIYYMDHHMEGIQYPKGINKQTWFSHSSFQHSLITNTRAMELKCDSVKDTSLNCEITMVQDPYFLDILPDLQMETLEGQIII